MTSSSRRGMDRLSGHWLRFLAGTAWRVRKRSDGHRVQRVRGHQRVRLVRLSGLRVEAAAARGVEVFATISLPLSPVPSRARCLAFLRLSHTVVPAPAVSCSAASPLTTAISTQPELPTRATASRRAVRRRCARCPRPLPGDLDGPARAATGPSGRR